MLQERLNDAAIALHYTLTQANIPYGIIGGYAISVLGGPRETSDIDCLASLSKQEAIALLDRQAGFVVVSLTRQDRVGFLWSDRPDGRNTVLVKVFCEQFGGAEYNMSGLQYTIHTVTGKTYGSGPCSFLDPFLIFKSKLAAAATRSKFYDSADLRSLVDLHGSVIEHRRAELNLGHLGFALEKYLELVFLFRRLRVDIPAAKLAVRGLVPPDLLEPGQGDVQRGLLG